MQRAPFRVKRIIILVFILFLSGCGYRFGPGCVLGGGLEEYRTISVPFIEGDDKGYLTSAIIHEIATRTPLQYVYSGGDLVLEVVFVEKESENIGYRYAPEKDSDQNGNQNGNKLSNIIVTEEGRLTFATIVTLRDRCRGEIIFGPVPIAHSLTFDFEPDFSNVNFQSFALGQLEMKPIAEEATAPSLDRLLAQKIVDSLMYCW